MLPGRELKFTPTPPSWWAASLGSSSSSSEMRERVPVMVAGLQVFTSLKMTGGRRGRHKKPGRQQERVGQSWDQDSGVAEKGKNRQGRFLGRVRRRRGETNRC